MIPYFKLITAGNTNIPSMVNAIIRATLQLRTNTKNEDIVFRQIHIFHTEQSLSTLSSFVGDWRLILKDYNIPTTSLVHHVTNLEDSNVDRFRDLVEQLKTIVNPLDNAHYYIDLTGGLSSLKAILAVFSYVLDIENIYSLEVEFSKDPSKRIQEAALFYSELIRQGIVIHYRKFPPIREFDDFGKLNYTEVLRHRQIIFEVTGRLSQLLPPDYDLELLRASLLSGINFRLLGELTGDKSSYRHSVYSYSAGVEEITNILFAILKNTSVENKTLGQKLADVRDLFTNNPIYFINEDVLEYLTRLTSEIRNDIVHPNPNTANSDIPIQAYLSAHLTSAFINFATNAIASFVDKDGDIVDVEILDRIEDSDKHVYYFGFDGDDTGKFIEGALFSTQDESQVLLRSKTISSAIESVCRMIKKMTKNHDAILFAQGDNILFKSRYEHNLLVSVQYVYETQTGLYSSIGFGKTMQEASIALRLAKAKVGNSILGVSIDT